VIGQTCSEIAHIAVLSPTSVSLPQSQDFATSFGA